jgi:2-amino-4-hydroxy-6-hydroxymethyldihydropteridine diphosphokinase
MTRVYVGIGANLNKPLQQVEQAIHCVSTLPKVTLIKKSGLYRSQPWGVKDQPKFINAVISIDTSLTPTELLQALQGVEQQRGRVRKGEQWGPRSIDLDILLYGKVTIATEKLTVPHCFLKEREFVLYPLYEICPELILPDGEILANVVASCPERGLELIERDTNAA